MISAGLQTAPELIDISSAHHQHQIACAAALLNGVHQAVHVGQGPGGVARLLNFFGQGGAADPFDRRFPSAVERSHQHLIGGAQGLGKTLHELSRTAVAMGLEHRHHPLGNPRQGALAAAHHQLGHGQGGVHLAGVVGVVIDDQPALPFAAQVKAPAWRHQLGECLLQISERGPGQTAGRHCSQGIAEVVDAGHGQDQLTKPPAVFEVVGPASSPIEAEGHSAELCRAAFFEAPPVIGAQL